VLSNYASVNGLIANGQSDDKRFGQVADVSEGLVGLAADQSVSAV